VSYFRLSGEQSRAISHCRRGHIALPSHAKIRDAFETTHTPKKSPEYYLRLAEKCRETAITVSAEKERADLLAMAQTWDLIASRVGHAPRRGSAVIDHGRHRLAR